MTLTTDNAPLNKAIIELAEAMKATDDALKAFDFDKVDTLEEKEAEKENVFFEIIFAMMPAKLSKKMQDPKYIGLFKGKTIDKYILS
jgi:hypothetical protein